MTNRSRQTTKLVLSDDGGQGRIQVELEAFFEFSFSLAEELEDLVSRWSHKAAPPAVAIGRARKPLPR